MLRENVREKMRSRMIVALGTQFQRAMPFCALKVLIEGSTIPNEILSF